MWIEIESYDTENKVLIDLSRVHYIEKHDDDFEWPCTLILDPEKAYTDGSVVRCSTKYEDLVKAIKKQSLRKFEERD